MQSSRGSPCLGVPGNFNKDQPDCRSYLTTFYDIFQSMRTRSFLQAHHWLPVQARTDYKLSIICHNFSSLTHLAACLSDFLTLYTPFRQICSSTDTRIVRNRHVKKADAFGQLFFSYRAPKQWNSLLSDTRHIQSSRPMPSRLH